MSSPTADSEWWRRATIAGALAGALAAAQDVASTVFWLSSGRERIRLVVALLTLGTAAGALASTLIALAFRVAPRRAHLVTGLLLFAPGFYVGWMLFAGGRMQRLPAVSVLRCTAGIALVAVGTLVLPVVARWVWTARSGRWSRIFVAALAVILAQVLHAADHRIFPRLYEYLHVALGVLDWGAWLAAVVVLAPAARASVRWAPVVLAASLAMLVASPRWLDAWPNVRAEVFGVHAPFARHVAEAIEQLRPSNTRSAIASRLARRRFEEQLRAERERRSTQSDSVHSNAHVVLVTIDALRADRVFPRAGAPCIAPTLCRIAESGWSYPRAYTQAPHSSYALASLHTGEYLHETVALGQRQPLPTLATVLGARGYYTAALFTPGIFFTAGERLTTYRDNDFGFARAEHVDRTAAAQTDAALREVDDVVRRGEPPAFLWVHYFDTHEPYNGSGSTERERYDHAVATVDHEVSRLLDGLHARWNRPIVLAIAADHGEEFLEHGGVYHGSTLYDEQVRVPLVLVVPGEAPQRVEAPVSLVDVAPTVLGLVGVSAPATMRGRDLRSAALGGSSSPWPVFAAVNTRVMVVAWPYKLIVDRAYSVSELYNLRDDPDEQRNLAGPERSRVAALTERLSAWTGVLGDAVGGRGWIARALLGDPEAVAHLASLIQQRGTSSLARSEAIDALADRLPDSPELRRTVHALLGDADWLVADHAALALGATDADARERLREMLSRDDVVLRTRAAADLAREHEPSDEMHAVLEDALALDDESLQDVAMDALTRVANERDVITLIDALPDDHLCYRAVVALGRAATPETVGILERVSRIDREADARANATAALSLALGTSARSLLVERALEGGNEVYAASALARIAPDLGWDARRDRWPNRARACVPVHESVTWEALDDWECSTDWPVTVSLPQTTGSRALLVVRARGTGSVEWTMGHDVVARMALSSSWAEWRVQWPTAFVTSRTDVQVVPTGHLDLAHAIVVPQASQAR